MTDDAPWRGDDAPRERRHDPASDARGWAVLAALLGVLLLVTAAGVLALARVPELRGPFMPGGTQREAEALLLTASLAALGLGGFAVIALAASARALSRALGRVDVLDEEVASSLRRDEVPGYLLDGSLVRDMRERDARYLTLEREAADLPRLRSEVEALRGRLAGAVVPLFDPVTGDRVRVPIRFEGAPREGEASGSGGGGGGGGGESREWFVPGPGEDRTSGSHGTQS